MGQTTYSQDSIKTPYNYLNPFSQTTTFVVKLQKSEFIKITIYDILGREIQQFGKKKFPSGELKIDFDTSNLSRGTYIYKISIGNKRITKKMIVTKYPY